MGIQRGGQEDKYKTTKLKYKKGRIEVLFTIWGPHLLPTVVVAYFITMAIPAMTSAPWDLSLPFLDFLALSDTHVGISG